MSSGVCNPCRRSRSRPLSPPKWEVLRLCHPGLTPIESPAVVPVRHGGGTPAPTPPAPPVTETWEGHPRPLFPGVSRTRRSRGGRSPPTGVLSATLRPVSKDRRRGTPYQVSHPPNRSPCSGDLESLCDVLPGRSTPPTPRPSTFRTQRHYYDFLWVSEDSETLSPFRRPSSPDSHFPGFGVRTGPVGVPSNGPREPYL